MKVHIDELVVECSHILPDRWNGWVRPVFTKDQVDAVGFRMLCDRELYGDNDYPFEEYVVDMGYGEYRIDGWCWELVTV